MDATFDDLMRHHAGASPGGVAVAFRALQRAQELLGRMPTAVRTAFGGPGARDAFVQVLGPDGYAVDPALARPDLGARRRFVFEFDGTLVLVLRDGFVTDEFVDLAGRDVRTDAEEARLTELKGALRDRVLAAEPAEVFDP